MVKKKVLKFCVVKVIYYFGVMKIEGKGVDCFIFGGKGVNLVEMIGIGFFVFFGFMIIIEVCY